MVKENSRNVGPGMRGIQHCIQLVLVSGESLDQVKTIGKYKDRETCFLRFSADELKELLGSRSGA